MSQYLKYAKYIPSAIKYGKMAASAGLAAYNAYKYMPRGSRSAARSVRSSLPFRSRGTSSRFTRRSRRRGYFSRRRGNPRRRRVKVVTTWLQHAFTRGLGLPSSGTTSGVTSEHVVLSSSQNSANYITNYRFYRIKKIVIRFKMQGEFHDQNPMALAPSTWAGGPRTINFANTQYPRLWTAINCQPVEPIATAQELSRHPTFKMTYFKPNRKYQVTCYKPRMSDVVPSNYMSSPAQWLTTNQSLLQHWGISWCIDIPASDLSWTNMKYDYDIWFKVAFRGKKYIQKMFQPIDFSMS